MNKLGGSIFVHNAIKYDYCIKEAIYSLCDLCDEVVVVDAQSDDGTVEILQDICQQVGKIKLYTNALWRCEPEGVQGLNRLNILANLAKDKLDTEWHFMLQADEVLHEDSIPIIRDLIRNDKYDSYLVRRINLYDDFDHYVKFDSQKRPCGDHIVRLGKRYLPAVGDAENLACEKLNAEYYEKIIIFHYGFIRNPQIMVDKIIDMQTWFGIGIDKRAIEQKKKYGRFIAKEIIPTEELAEIQWNHPKYAIPWIQKRQIEDQEEQIKHKEMLEKYKTKDVANLFDRKIDIINTGYDESDFTSDYWLALQADGTPRIERDFRFILEFLTNLLSKTNTKTVIDIGAGCGKSIVDARNIGIDMSGCEFSKSGIQIAKEKFDIEIDWADLRETLPYQDNKFDWACCVGVLSYLPENKIKHALSEIFRIVEYGALLLAVPYAGEYSAHLTGLKDSDWETVLNDMGLYKNDELLKPQDFNIGIAGEFCGLWTKNR